MRQVIYRVRLAKLGYNCPSCIGMVGPSREFCQKVDSEMKQGRESITKLGPLVLFVTFGLSLALLALVWLIWPW